MMDGRLVRAQDFNPQFLKVEYNWAFTKKPPSSAKRSFSSNHLRPIMLSDWAAFWSLEATVGEKPASLLLFNDFLTAEFILQRFMTDLREIMFSLSLFCDCNLLMYLSSTIQRLTWHQPAPWTSEYKQNKTADTETVSMWDLQFNQPAQVSELTVS